MRRRELLALCGGASTAALAGCTGDGGGATDAPTGTATPGATASPPGTPAGTIEYTVVNDDDVSHEVTTELTAGGTVVEGTTRTLPPGESVTTTSRGNDPDRGPYELTVSPGQTSLTTELKPGECPYINIGIRVTAEGTLSTEREVCQG
ncbi:MAG: hypothetical protein ABEI11_00630 [Haloarculaceae archaeon]